jgi:exosortase
MAGVSEYGHAVRRKIGHDSLWRWIAWTGRMTTVREQAAQAYDLLGRFSWGAAAAWLGLVILAVPTLLANARQSWSSEQGEQGPIVLAIGLWLLARNWPSMRRAATPGPALFATACLLGAGIVYVLGRVWDQFEVETYGLYALALAGLYATIGLAGLARGWFPLVYLIFALPPPYALSWFLTSHLRLAITEAAVALFQALGLSIVRDGLNIMIDQYQLAVQNACSGMNSLFSLSAVGLVYIYLRRGSKWWYIAAMLPPILVFAVFGNFARVVVVIALTHYFGDATAQGILHEATGFLTFLVALVGVIAVDAIVGRLVLGGVGQRRRQVEFA